MVISVLSGKGGTGKSTVVVNLAGALIATGSSVLIVDNDPQGTISMWADKSECETPEVLVEPSAVLTAKIGEVRTRYDFVIIDTPPAFGASMVDAIRACDGVLVPVVPGTPDLWSVRQLLEIYESEKATRPDLKIKLLISKAEHRSVLGRDFRQFLDLLGYPVCATEIMQRAVYGRSWLHAKTVDLLEPKGPAAQEFRALGEEVRTWRRK